MNTTTEEQTLTTEPGDSPRSSPLAGSIFELTDATNDETYYALGLYLTVEEAIRDATSGDSPPTECEEYARLEVNERDMGFSGWGNNGRKVAEIEWKQRLDEATDEWVWEKPTVSNTELTHPEPEPKNHE